MTNTRKAARDYFHTCRRVCDADREIGRVVRDLRCGPADLATARSSMAERVTERTSARAAYEALVGKQDRRLEHLFCDWTPDA